MRPRRSVLYMPGANARAMDKARDLACDSIIFDLEDAVAPGALARGGKTLGRESAKCILQHTVGVLPVQRVGERRRRQEFQQRVTVAFGIREGAVGMGQRKQQNTVNQD